MKFQKIILTNFRQFKGKNEICFSIDDKKNITLVYGGITCGKTTLLQAFNWTFYDRVELENPNELLNLEISNELKYGDAATVEVEIYLEFDGENYRLKRTQKYLIKQTERYVKVVSKSGSYAVAEKESNDTWIPAGNYDDIVNKIMPSNLSTYFFFDGERIDKISRQQREGTKEVEISVKEILGLEHYSTAIKHLSNGKNSVIAELKSRLNTTANSELAELKSRYQKLEELIEDNEEKIFRYENENDRLEKEKRIKEQLIFDNRSTYEKQQEKSNLKNKLDGIVLKETNAIENYKNFFNSYYLDFFYNGLTSKMNELRRILDIKEEGIPNMHAHSIEYILKRGYCICGEKFVLNDKRYDSLVSEMKKLPPQSIGTSITNFNQEIMQKISSDKSDNFKNEIFSKYESILEIIEEKDDLIEKIERISDNIATDVNVGELEREVREIEIRIRDNTGLIAIFKENISRAEHEKKRIDDKITQLSQYDDRNREIANQIQYAEKISRILNTTYVGKEKELREKLEKEINKYLTKIYTGERYLRITDDYRFILVYIDDVDAEEDSAASEGLGTVKAISFMCGLLDVAKSKFLDDITEETEYPLVFDAPLSKIDSEHIRNVMECLSETASQVIAFIREKKDLEAITDKTRKKIGKEFYIRKISERCSEISDDSRKEV